MEFHSPVLDDMKWAEPLLKSNDFMGSHFVFTNIFMWQDHAEIQISRFEDFVIIKADYKDGYINYQYPCGTGKIILGIKKSVTVKNWGNRW